MEITPLTGFRHLQSSSATTSSRSPTSFYDAYTRFAVARIEKPSNQSGSGAHKILEYPETHWYNLFSGQQFDLALSAKLTAGVYSETLPLGTVSSSKGSDGAVSSRALVHDVVASSWFLMDSSVDPAVTVTLAGSLNYSSGAASSALTVALDTTKLLAPQASLVTALSAPAIRAKSEALDSAIGKLFSSKVSESHRSKVELPSGLVQVRLLLPFKEGDWNGDLGDVGVWEIRLDTPRISMFAEEYFASGTRGDFEAAASRAYKAMASSSGNGANRVLAFPLLSVPGDSTTTVRSFISVQPAFMRSVGLFTGVLANDKLVADRLCDDIRQMAADNRFNTVDTNIILWAVLEMTVKPALVAEGTYQRAPSCKLPDDLGHPGSPSAWEATATTPQGVTGPVARATERPLRRNTH